MPYRKSIARHLRVRPPFRAPTAVALVSSLVSSVPALAQEAHTELAPVVVTANPLGSGLFDMVTPVSVVNRKDLSDRSAATLGEALEGVPGVSASNFGPNASRPVIRGLDADRIKLMQNGVGIMDVSALSPDHAVPIDPLVIDQIEVVRGPAALLYGGSAIGGVVNAIDNRIPQDALSGVSGRAEARIGGAGGERSSAAVVEGGNGVLSLHVDAFQRRTDDLRIPDYARSDRLRASDPQTVEARGRLPNSNGKSDGGALGASLNFEQGYAGLSYSTYTSDYGTVAEENVRIHMRSERLDFAGELRDLGTFVEKVKLRYAHTDYQHEELESGQVGTVFRTRGDEASIEATHGKIGLLSGVFGVQVRNADFSAQGDEALLPSIRTTSRAVYLYEELPWEQWKFSFGGRIERADLDSAGGGPDDANNPGTPRFGNARSRSFTPKSLAAGALYKFNEAWSLSTNLSHAERAPSYNELFANGAHPATGQYEVGNPDLGVEKSNGLDLQLRWKRGTNTTKVGAFHTRFKDYIALYGTGTMRDADGLIDPAGALPEAQVRAVPARFSGLEAESKFHVYQGLGDLDLRLKADYVRASNADTGEPLPRIAPYHLGLGFDYRLGAFGARFDATYAGRQNRVAANELPTDAYTLLNATLSYRLRSSLPEAEVFLKLNNLLNEEIRLSTSVLKDIAPLGGRSSMLGVRLGF
ncbi:MAG: TonB-dependent receptor [Rhodocyclaceae bacterium]|nr:TonB-dependent receptor [Rhodocyclaceae bacterium]